MSLSEQIRQLRATGKLIGDTLNVLAAIVAVADEQLATLEASLGEADISATSLANQEGS